MTKQAIEICTSGQAAASVIWLHGLGADGQDFVPVVEMLDLPTIRFVLPHAPYRNVTINNGAEMRAWYDVYGFTLSSLEDETGIRESQVSIESLIEAEIARGIPSERIILAGFSQGGAIALHTALHHKKTLAGIIALSTYLPLKSSLKKEKAGANQTIPIFMAHGVDDEVISLDTCQTSLTLLQSEQYDVEWHEYPMSHSVCLDEINDIRAFLRTMLKI
jgi:phospholipase/carboxylesterase